NAPCGPAPLRRTIPARVVHEDAMHCLRRDRIEVRSIGPGDARLVDEPEVRLVNERSGVERVALVLATQLARRDRAKLVVNEVEQPVERLLFARTPGEEETGDVGIAMHRERLGESLGAASLARAPGTATTRVDGAKVPPSPYPC